MKKANLLISIFIFSTLNAQNLSLSECINKTLNTHPDIKRFVLQVEQSKYGKDVARADYLPQISLSGEYDPTRTYSISQNGAFSTKQDDGWQTGVVLNQKIWDFSKTTSAIKAAQKTEDIAKLSLKDTKALLAYYVKLQYELMVVQNEAINVRKKDMQTKDELYKQAKALVKQGIKTKADESRFLSAFYNAKDNLSIAQANFEKARVSLSAYIGEDIDKNVELDDTIISKNILHVQNPMLYEMILKNNPQLLGIKESIVKNEFLYKAAKASRYGSIDASLSYIHQDMLNEYDSSVVGITFKVPLYSGGRTSALIQEAMIAKEISKKEYDSKELALKQEFEQLTIDLKRYDVTIESKKVQLQASVDVKKLTEARYKEGISTYIEVLDAISLYLDSKLGLIEAYYAKSSIINKIEYLQGKII